MAYPVMVLALPSRTNQAHPIPSKVHDWSIMSRIKFFIILVSLDVVFYQVSWKVSLLLVWLLPYLAYAALFHFPVQMAVLSLRLSLDEDLMRMNEN